MENSWGLGVHAGLHGMGKTWTFGEVGGQAFGMEKAVSKEEVRAGHRQGGQRQPEFGSK